MFLGLLFWFCEVALALTEAKELVPQLIDSSRGGFDRSLTPNVFSRKSEDEMLDFKITKTVFSEGSSLYSWDSKLTLFENSKTILLLRGGKLHISFNNGDKWSIVDGIQDNISLIEIDQFNGERVIAYGQSRNDKKFKTYFNMYITEDSGQTWRKISSNFPEDVDWCSFFTNPFNRNYLLLNCDLETNGTFRQVTYISNDGGRSFTNILSSNEIHPSRGSSVYCYFAASSKDSNFAPESVYCIYSMEEETTEKDDLTDQRILFYTADMGKTTHVVEKLRGYYVMEMYILSAQILITVQDAEESSNEELWISNGRDDFQKAILPGELDNFQYIDVSDEKVMGCTLLNFRRRFDENGRSALLKLDPIGTNFTTYDPFLEDVLREAFIKDSKSHDATVWGEFFFHHDSDDLSISKSKVSFDQGTNWLDMRVVDPLNKYSHLFECDIRNTNDCSLQIKSNSGIPMYESATGVVIATGFVASNKTSGCFPDGRHSQTFISKNGGATWEILFDFQISSLCSTSDDFLVALPLKKSEDKEEYHHAWFDMTISSFEIYISRNRGETWEKHTFEEPVISESYSPITCQSSYSRVFVGVSEIHGFHARGALYTINFS